MKGGRDKKVDDIERARELFERLEGKKVSEKGKSTLEVLDRVRKSGGDIRGESLRRFRIQQKLEEVREVKLKGALVC